LLATLIMTTLGSTFCATAWVEPAGALATLLTLGVGASSALFTTEWPVSEELTSAPTAPPTPPLTSASAIAPMTSPVRIGRRAHQYPVHQHAGVSRSVDDLE